jgi:hypothetical protein
VRLLVAAAAASAGSLGLAGTASAQYVTPQPPTGPAADGQTVTQVVLRERNPRQASAVQAGGARTARAAARSARRGLPVTGGDVVGLTALGAGAIAVGGLILRLGRRPSKS